MMTSRSEYRLLLRQDNADVRLTPTGYKVGLVSEERYRAFVKKQENIENERKRLEKTHLSPAAVREFLLSKELPEVSSGISLADLLRRPQISYAELAALDPDRPVLTKREREALEVEVKYEGYVKKQLAEVARSEKLENRRLPDDIDYSLVKGLRIEAAQKLAKIRPQTFGQAARISGVNPADISVLLIYLS